MEMSVSTLAAQVSSLVMSTAANTSAVEDLKTLLTKFLQKTNSTSDCSPSVSISAMETEGDPRPPIVEVAKSFPSHVPGLLSKSASEGGLLPDPAQQAPGKETSIVPTTLQALAIPEEGGTVKASARPALKTMAVTAPQAAVPLTVARSSGPKKSEALQAAAHHDSAERVEEQLVKETMVPELGKAASHKCHSHKGKEGAMLRKGTAVSEKERQQLTANKSDGALKGPVQRMDEINDAYSLQAPLTVGTPLTTSARVTTPAEQTVEVSARKSARETAQVAVVAKQDQATIQVRSVELSLIPRLPINSGTSKLLVFNVHGTLLDCSMVDDKNPNTEIRPSAFGAGRRIIFRPWMAQFFDHCFLRFKVAFWGSKSAKYMEDMVPILLGRLKGVESCVPCFVWKGRNH